jgi:hypothetical protein
MVTLPYKLLQLQISKGKSRSHVFCVPRLVCQTEDDLVVNFAARWQAEQGADDAGCMLPNQALCQTC